MTAPEVQVIPQGWAWLSFCHEHGPLTMWGNELGASLDVLGHVAHFHSRPTTPACGPAYPEPGTPPPTP